MKKTYNVMLVRTISGIPVSRHCTAVGAIRTLRRKDSARDPIEMRDYSEKYWNEMR